MLATAFGTRLQDLMDTLGVDLCKYGDSYVGACPVHGGDNQSAFRMNGPHHEYPLSWVCWSHGCQEHWGRGMVGFVRGVLSHNLHCWNGAGDQEISWKDFFIFAEEFLGENMPKNTIKKEKPRIVENVMWSAHEYRKMVSIPSRYYVGRNFSEEILQRYSVGDCLKYGQFYKRAIIPLLKDNSVVGVSSRSILKECPQCSFHHEGDCPPKEHRHYPSYQRWAHKGFSRSKILYNMENYKTWMKNEKIVILVESPNSVLRIEEAKIPGAMATLGCKISRGQLEILAEHNVEKIILIMDNDKAGFEGARSITEKYAKDFQLIVPNLDIPSGKDIADYSAKIIQRNFYTILKRFQYPI